MANGLPLNGPRNKHPFQPPCCGLQVSRKNRFVTCDTCWEALVPQEEPASSIVQLP